MDKDATRRNQTLFRDVNERIAEITREQEEDASEFLCECGRADCVSHLVLPLAEYEELRADSAIFIAAPGHCVEGVDRKIEERDGFKILIQI